MDLFKKILNKRLCLPKNYDIHDECKFCILSKIKEENYRHSASICFHNTDNIISHGFNTYDENLRLSTHAERACIDNLQIIQKRRKLVKIDLYVGRYGIKNQFLMSKPCMKCIQYMNNNIIMSKGYKLINIYYTNENNNITKTNLYNLNNEEMHITKAMKKNYKY